MHILLVCTNNTCRSPLAAGVLAHVAAQRGVAVEVDSAGLGTWHVGEPPVRHAVVAAYRRGIELTGVARQIRRKDFETFDLILGMDRRNVQDLKAMVPPTALESRIRLLREWDPAGPGDVPDPYSDGVDGFDRVIDIVQRSCRALVEDLGGRGAYARPRALAVRLPRQHLSFAHR